MKRANLTHELYESPTKDRNEEKYGMTTGNQCICCMKPMAEGETKRIRMNEYWVAVRTDVKIEDYLNLTGAQIQGEYEIGNSCAKKMPKEFIIN